MEIAQASASTAANVETSTRVGLIGAGNFAVGTLLPAMQRVNGTELIGVCAATGAHSRHAADKFRFRYSTTDESQILNDRNINTVVIATRHHLHAREILAALDSFRT
jgi:predicted dehydrogenase